jgi:hypothetical protein
MSATVEGGASPIRSSHESPNRPSERMDTSAAAPVLSTFERERLAALLAGLPDPRRWAVTHRHAPLLCALGLADAPDPGYAHAAQRRLSDPAESRRRALALLDELDRDARSERYEQRRRERRHRRS